MGVYFYSHYERHWALKKIFLKKVLKNPWQVRKIVVHYKSRYKQTTQWTRCLKQTSKMKFNINDYVKQKHNQPINK